jgi:hypothetical protein
MAAVGRLDRLGATPRLALAGLGLLGALALGASSAGPPRLTLANTAIVVDYPWTRGASGLGAGAALALSAACVPRARLRLGLALVGLVAVGAGLQLLLSRTEASASGLRSRGLLGSTSLAWSEVAAVGLRAGALVIEGAGRRIEVDTTDFTPEQRSALERTIARRVAEVGSGRVLTLPE